MKNLFLDMDGVFVDFNGGFKERFKVNAYEMQEEKVWKLIEDTPDYWEKLPAIPMGKIFFRALQSVYVDGHVCNIRFLTAVPRSSFIQSANSKKKWVQNHIGDFEVIPVSGGRNKAAYIQKPGDILIDDKKENVASWHHNGGCGVLHENGDYVNTWNLFMEIMNGECF